MLKKVVSGGQTGADYGGLIIADLCNLETGGWAPPNFMTERGPDYNLEEYNLKAWELISDSPNKLLMGYLERTEANVRDSDATVIIASNFESKGSVATLRYIKKHKKPHFMVDFNNPPNYDDLKNFIEDNNVNTLNVAGNRESLCPGIKKFTMDYLENVFNELSGSE